MPENESHLPGDIPQSERVFFDSIKQFTQDIEFIINQQSMDMVDSVCDAVYQNGVLVIQDILDDPNKLYCVMEFNPCEQFDKVMSCKIEEELQKSVFIRWKNFFIESAKKGRTAHEGSYIQFVIKY